MNNFNFEYISQQIQSDINLKNASLSDSYFYQSLSLCVIDAVFSIGVKYSSTKNVVQRYTTYFNLEQYRPRDIQGYPNIDKQDSLRNLVDRMEQLSISCFTEDILKNKQRTSTKSGILKTEAVFRFATILLENNINTFEDVEHLFQKSEKIKKDISKIPGQKSGISYDYFLMLVGNDDLIKPDRMISRYFEGVTQEKLKQKDLLHILKTCSDILEPEYGGLTPRMLDHEIWKFERQKENPPAPPTKR